MLSRWKVLMVTFVVAEGRKRYRDEDAPPSDGVKRPDREQKVVSCWKYTKSLNIELHHCRIFFINSINIMDLVDVNRNFIAGEESQVSRKG